jgi:hypothetical protein
MSAEMRSGRIATLFLNTIEKLHARYKTLRFHGQ